MSNRDWFRSEIWNDLVAEAFDKRLRRSRPHNAPQYLRIQAYHLIQSGQTSLPSAPARVRRPKKIVDCTYSFRQLFHQVHQTRIDDLYVAGQQPQLVNSCGCRDRAIRTPEQSRALSKKGTRGRLRLTSPRAAMRSLTKTFQFAFRNASRAGATPLTIQPFGLTATTQSLINFPLRTRASVSDMTASVLALRAPRPIESSLNSTANIFDSPMPATVACL